MIETCYDKSWDKLRQLARLPLIAINILVKDKYKYRCGKIKYNNSDDSMIETCYDKSWDKLPQASTTSTPVPLSKTKIEIQ